MEKIEERIRQAIQKASEYGYTLVCEDWGDDYQDKKCGCALGCLLVSNGIKLRRNQENYDAAVDTLGKDKEWVDSFIAGFDKGFITYGVEPIKDAYEMGERLRAEMKPIRYHVFLQRKKA